MNYLMIQGPDGQTLQNCPEMIKQLSVAELKHMPTRITQTLEVWEVETDPQRRYCGDPVVILTRKEGPKLRQEVSAMPKLDDDQQALRLLPVA